MEKRKLGDRRDSRSRRSGSAAWGCRPSTATPTRRSRSRRSSARSSSGSTSSTRPRSTARSTNEELVGRAVAGRRDDYVIATKFGMPAGARRAGRMDARARRLARERAPLGRGLARAPRHRPHRPLLPAPHRPEGADRGDGRGAGRAGRGGQGPPHRPQRGGAGDDPPRARDPPDHRGADRVLALDPRPRGARSCRRCGSWGSGWSPTRRSGAASSPVGSSRRTTSTQDDFRRSEPRFTGENLERNLELAAKVEELAAEKGVHAGAARARWVLAQGDDIVPIPGTKRRSYLEQNAGGARGRAHRRRPRAHRRRAAGGGRRALRRGGDDRGQRLSDRAGRRRGLDSAAWPRPITFLSDYGADRRVRRRLPGGDRADRARGAGDRPQPRDRPPRRRPGRGGARERARRSRRRACTSRSSIPASAPSARAGRGRASPTSDRLFVGPDNGLLSLGDRALRRARSRRSTSRARRSGSSRSRRPSTAATSSLRSRRTWRSATSLAELGEPIDPGDAATIDRGEPRGRARPAARGRGRATSTRSAT